MTPDDALTLIDNVMDSITLIAKKGGNESGLTTGDRVQLKQAVAIIRGELARTLEKIKKK